MPEFLFVFSLKSLLLSLTGLLILHEFLMCTRIFLIHFVFRILLIKIIVSLQLFSFLGWECIRIWLIICNDLLSNLLAKIVINWRWNIVTILDLFDNFRLLLLLLLHHQWHCTHIVCHISLVRCGCSLSSILDDKMFNLSKYFSFFFLRGSSELVVLLLIELLLKQLLLL